MRSIQFRNELRKLGLITGFVLASINGGCPRTVVRPESPDDLPFQVAWKRVGGLPLGMESLFAVDEETLWAAGDGGSLYFSTDRGENWNRKGGLRTSQRFASIWFSDRRHGWVVGDNGTIITTSDRGETWQEQESNTEEDLRSVVFVDRRYGWAVGMRGVILHTRNGGHSWTPERWKSSIRLASVYGVDRESVWIVGRNGIVLTKGSDGEHWSEVDLARESLRGIGLDYLESIHFHGTRGAIVGFEGLLLTTNDGGESWRRSSILVEGEVVPRISEGFLSVQMVNDSTGFSVGEDGLIAETIDGGDSWSIGQVGQETSHFSFLHFPSRELGWAGGRDGDLYRGKQVNKAPFIDEVRSEDSTSGVKTQLHIADEEPDTVSFEFMEIRNGSDEPWQRVSSGPLPNRRGFFELDWHPDVAEVDLPKGSTYSIRVQVKDHRGVGYTHEIEGDFVYSNWWGRFPPWAKWTIIAVLLTISLPALVLALSFFLGVGFIEMVRVIEEVFPRIKVPWFGLELPLGKFFGFAAYRNGMLDRWVGKQVAAVDRSILRFPHSEWTPPRFYAVDDLERNDDFDRFLREYFSQDRRWCLSFSGGRQEARENLLHEIARRFIADGEEALAGHKVIPIRLDAKVPPDGSLIEAITSVLHHTIASTKPLSPRLVKNLLRKNRAVLLIQNAERPKGASGGFDPMDPEARACSMIFFSGSQIELPAPIAHVRLNPRRRFPSRPDSAEPS